MLPGVFLHASLYSSPRLGSFPPQRWVLSASGLLPSAHLAAPTHPSEPGLVVAFPENSPRVLDEAKCLDGGSASDVVHISDTVHTLHLSVGITA